MQYRVEIQWKFAMNDDDRDISPYIFVEKSSILKYKHGTDLLKLDTCISSWRVVNIILWEI